MFRGSSFLLTKSYKHFIPLIEYIYTCPDRAWELDCDVYHEAGYDWLINSYQEIKELLVPNNPYSSRQHGLKQILSKLEPKRASTGVKTVNDGSIPDYITFSDSIRKQSVFERNHQRGLLIPPIQGVKVVPS